MREQCTWKVDGEKKMKRDINLSIRKMLGKWRSFDNNVQSPTFCGNCRRIEEEEENTNM